MPPNKRSKEEAPQAEEIWRQLERKGISIHSIASRLQVNRGHLHRVLRGQRRGSRALLEALAELVEAMPGRRPQEESARLIDAAVHMFFLKRGDFDSEIFSAGAWRGQGTEKRRRG
jgi:transcriptional regulator with XRE-family HTH domain